MSATMTVEMASAQALDNENRGKQAAEATDPDVPTAMECNGSMSSPDARFREFCKKLELDESCMEQALKFFHATQSIMVETSTLSGNVGDMESERVASAAIAYVVKKMDKRVSPGFTLTQILQASDMSITEFFKEVPAFLAKCETPLKAIYGDDFERKLLLREDQTTFIHLLILFNYYKRTYSEYFKIGSLEVSTHQKFGWFLFLAVRTHVLGRFPDLVTSTNALLAVIAIMIVHMPTSLRKFSLDDKSVFPRQDPDGVNIIASLSHIGDAYEEDVRKILEKAQNMILSIFTGLSGNSNCRNVQSLCGFSTEGLMYFEGLMEDDVLTSHIQILERNYDEAYNTRGDVDERLCMSGEEGFEMIAAVSASLMHRDKDSQGTSVIQPMTSPCASPSRSPAKMSSASQMPPPTPVSTTMTTAKWLRTVITPLPAEPTAELQGYFKSCDRDVTDEVIHRAKVLLEAIFPTHPIGSWRATLQSSGSMDSTWSEQRRLEAMKLYYKVLGAICRAESQRLNSGNLTSFLTNEKFHRCMLTCSAELVLATHKTVVMTFPAVLEPSGLTAFDLGKVTENFVRFEDSLPRELKRHLNSIEERLLETMAWEKGSSMYNSLIVAKPKLAQEVARLGLLAEPMPSLDTLIPQRAPELDKGENGSDASRCSPEREASATLQSMDQFKAGSFSSPAKERLSAFSAFNAGKKNFCHLQSAFASPHRPNPLAGGETCAETTINMFFQKVLKLAAIRIKGICERLQPDPTLPPLPAHVIEQMYRVFQYALTNVTSIFFNRHIDQIILCSMYGVCKILKIKMTFRWIIHQYRKQPQCKAHVFRNVFLRRGKVGYETGDIIRFYNEIFVPATKNFILTIAAGASNGDAAEQHPAPSSPKPTFPTIPDMSPKKVSAKHNVFVSPLRSTKVENIMSPHSRSLYACLGESTRSYQSPSRDLTNINHRLNNGRRFQRLDFDEPSPALMSDSFVAGAFCPSIPANNHPAPPASPPASGPAASPSVPRSTSDSAWESPPGPAKRPKLDR